MDTALPFQSLRKTYGSTVASPSAVPLSRLAEKRKHSIHGYFKMLGGKPSGTDRLYSPYL